MKRESALLVSLLALLIGVSGGWWLVDRQRSTEPVTTPTDQGSELAGTSKEHRPKQPDGDGSALSSKGPTNAVAGGHRRSVAERGPHGVVRDSSGTPIGGAEVSWTRASALQDDSGGNRWDALIAASMFVVTDSEGRFEFEPPSMGVGRGVVWATCPGWKESAQEVHWGAPGPFIALEFELTEFSGCAASVLDDLTGERVPGATIFACGDAWYPGAPIAADWQEDPLLCWAYPLLVRSASTDSKGEVTMARFSGPARSEARHGGRLSRRRHGWMPEEATYRLCSTYELEVTLDILDPVPPGEQLQLTLVQTKAEDGSVAYSAVGELETISSPQRFTLARSESWSQGFEVGSPHTVLTTHEVGFPGEGELVQVRVPVRRSRGLELLVVDTEGEPIQGAALLGVYYDENSDVAGSHETWTDEEGRGTVTGMPEVSAWVQVEAQDYTSRTVGSFLTEELGGADLEVHRVELEPSGSLEGFVLHGGIPVETFHLSIWRGNENSVRIPVRGSEDGSFRVDGLPIGTLQLIVASAEQGLGPSPIQHVQVDQGLNGPVRIELSPSVEGRGRIVDGVTGEPIPGARVYPQLTAGYMSRGEFGEGERGDASPALTDGEGRWNSLGFLQGRCNMKVFAEGYPTSFGVAYLDGDGPLDFGTVPMYRDLDITVRVVGRPVDQLAGMTVSCEGSRSAGPITTDSAGEAVLRGLEVGYYTIYVESPSGETFVAKRYLYAELGAEVMVQTGGEASLLVNFEDAKGQPTRLTGVLGCSSRRGDGFDFSQLIEVNGEEVVTLTGLPETTVDLLAWDEAWTFLGSSTATPQVSGPPQATLRLLGSRGRIRVVDVRGVPIPDVVVYAQCTEPGSMITESGTTTSNGVATLGLDPSRPYAVRLRHSMHGEHGGIAVEFSRDGTPVEVVMDGTGTVRVELRSEGEPLTGVMASLEHPAFQSAYSLASPDSRGRLTFRDVGPGPLRLTVHAPGLWATSAPVQSTRFDFKYEVIDIPRVVDTSLRFSEGELTDFENFDLEYLPTGEWVSEWIEQDRILYENRPGPDARVALGGIPTGDYRWVATRYDGAETEGRFEVTKSTHGQVVQISPGGERHP